MTRIAALEASDTDAAIALWEQTGLTRPWNDPHEDFLRAVTGPTSAVLGLFEEEELVGTAMVGHDGHRGWVYYLGVTPKRCRQGLGRRLMSACEDWLRERDVPKLNIMVRSENDAVRGFYGALGYETDAVTVVSRRLDRRVRA